MKLSYKRWPVARLPGLPPLPRVLFLHGMGGTGGLWRPIAAGLEDGFDVLAPDQRGHGGSQIPAHDAPSGGREKVDYSPLSYAQDVIELMEELAFYPSFIVGHSMGVRTAAGIAHLRPDWVKGLVCVDLGFSGVAGGGLGEGLASFLRLLPPSFASRAEARAFMLTHCPDPSIGQYLLAVSVSSPAPGLPEQVTFPFDRAALIETIASARDSSVHKWILAAAQNDIPLLVLRGGKSLVWSPEEFAKEAKSLAAHPKALFETFEGAGHGLPFEKRPEFIKRLTDFFSFCEK